MKSKFLTGESLSAIAVALVIGATFMIIVAQIGLPNSIITALATLAAAFTGAWAAFTLHSKREESEKHRGNIEAANKALFVIVRMLNALTVIKEQVIDPYRDSPARFLLIQPYLIPAYNELKFDMDSLFFVLDGDPNVLGELISIENNFQITINSLELRNQIHRNEVQPKLEEAGVEIGGHYLICL